MKVGDKVRLLYDAGDLRQDIKVGDVGTVTGGPYTHSDNREWFWVQWLDEGEPAMRMWPEELEVIA